MNALPQKEVRRIQGLARAGLSARAIQELTGHSTNTIYRHAGKRPAWGPVRALGRAERCQRCGYSPSSHTPSSKARRAGNPNVCARSVAVCSRCGGWRSTYGASMCQSCRMAIAKRRSEQWQATEPARLAAREKRRQRRALRQGHRTLIGLRRILRGQDPLPQPESARARTSQA